MLLALRFPIWGMGRHAEEMKTALVLALQLAEKGLDGLPIPGVKGCIGGILKIIEQEDLRKANMETFRGLVETIEAFGTVTIERLLKGGNLPEELKGDVQRLAKKLEDIPKRYTEKIGEGSTRKRLKGFFFAGDNAEALNNLATELKDAMELFRTALLVHIELAVQNSENDRLIDKLIVERMALFDAHRQHKIELCEQDTRVSLLADATEWAKGTGPHHERRIMWLNGRAGVGKSTIAITLATRFREPDLNILGGSFMFSKPNRVTDGSKVFTTIAYQLAQHLPGFREHLATAIKAKEDSIHAGIHQQCKDLLVTPLSRLQSLPATTVVILDALDECTSETLTDILPALVETTSRFPFLRLLITSRPEPLIRQVLYPIAEHVYEVDVNEIPASEDIETYLRARLSSGYRRIMGRYSKHQTWPAEADLASLVNLADNLFVFAATAVRFITDERCQPESRLESILRGSRKLKEHPFSTLDTMYEQIVKNVLLDRDKTDDDHERFYDIVGAIVYCPVIISVNSLEVFFEPKYTAERIRNLLNNLHSVIVVPEEDNHEGLKVYHKSFADFITDPTRCTPSDALVGIFHRARLCNFYIQPILVQQGKANKLTLTRLSAHLVMLGEATRVLAVNQGLLPGNPKLLLRYHTGTEFEGPPFIEARFMGEAMSRLTFCIHRDDIKVVYAMQKKGADTKIEIFVYRGIHKLGKLVYNQNWMNQTMECTYQEEWEEEEKEKEEEWEAYTRTVSISG